jgi:hypothetical protein
MAQQDADVVKFPIQKAGTSENSSAMMSSNQRAQSEFVLKQENDVLCRNSFVLLQGTLFLTDKRLVFTVAARDEAFFSNNAFSLEAGSDNVSENSDKSLSIPLTSIVSAKGRKGMLRPSLEINWRDNEQNEQIKTEFTQKTGHTSNSANADISGWAEEIQRLSASEIEKAQDRNFLSLKNDTNSIEWDIMDVLDDSEWKGLFQIEKELKDTKGIKIDFEQLEGNCRKLVSAKLAETDKIGEFYRKRASSDSLK